MWGNLLTGIFARPGARRAAAIALAAATIFLTACATAGSDAPPGACTPLVDHSRAEQARVAEEVAALSEGTAIVGWLADYAVLREQARACRRISAPR